MHPALSPTPSALLVGACALGILGGCDITIRDGDIKGVSMRHKASTEWTRDYPLAAGGRVELVNTNGPIDVAVGPAGAVHIAAVIEAGAMSETRAREMLTEVTMDETVTPDHVRVAAARKARGGGLVIRFKVTMPADGRLEMTTNNGDLKAEGLRAHVKAMVVNGGIELSALRGTVDAAGVNASVSAKMAEVSGPVRLEATNGRIALELPKTAKATLNARSVNGSITVTGLNVEQGEGRRIRTLESPLNGGGPEIDLRVTNGRISITGGDGSGSPKSPGSPTSRPRPPSPPSPPPLPPRP